MTSFQESQSDFKETSKDIAELHNGNRIVMIPPLLDDDIVKVADRQGYVVDQLHGKDNYGLSKKDINRVITRVEAHTGSMLVLSAPLSTSVAHRTVYLRNICSLIKAHRGSFYLWTPFNPRGKVGPVMEWLTQSFGVCSTNESS